MAHDLAPSDPDATAPYVRWLSSIYRGRPWIVASDVLAGTFAIADPLEALGAAPPLCIAASTGLVGSTTTPRAPEPIVLGLRTTDGAQPRMLQAIRDALDALADLPAWAVERIDAFDPERRARVIGPMFDDGRPVAGRAKYGSRPEAWQRLEDKTTVDALWDAAGVPRAPSRIVAAELSALQAASSALDAGAGCVWVGDNRGGFHGGAAYVRWIRAGVLGRAGTGRKRAQHADGRSLSGRADGWIRSDHDAREAARFFASRCDVVRVMPFLEGIPCSIHALALPDRTLVFRPCEMIVLRRPGESGLQYAQAGTFWDPPAADRDAMRAFAMRVGDHLRETVDYRGFLTIDGVMTADGFLPTELNPRLGAAARWLVAGLGLSLTLCNAAIIEGEPFDWDPAALETLLVAHANRHRGAQGMVIIARSLEEQREQRIVFGDDGQARPARSEEPEDATLVTGPAASGGVVMVRLAAERTPTGPSVAPRICAALAWADATWELGIGALEPALDVRRA